jgi:putative FmdB family regulatory protein
MPIYEYVHVSDRGPGCAETIEVMQGIKEKPLTRCPACGKPVRKAVSRPMKAIMNGGKLTDSRIAKSGLTKYVKTGDGTYEKAAGPDDSPSKIGE